MYQPKSTPLARSQGLVIEELGDELLVYDLGADRAHSLSPAAARVWRRCDGETRVDALGAELGLETDTIEHALEELSACELLETPAGSAPGSTRRELSVKMVKAGAAVAAAPLILSVAAPTPAAAVTPGQCISLTSSTQSCGSGEGSNGCLTIGCCCCNPACGSTPCPDCQGFPSGTKHCSDSVATCRTRCGSTSPAISC